MPIIAGDIKEIAIDHPELGGIVLEHKSTEDVSFVKGGYQNADDDGSITATGTKIFVKNYKGWMLETTIGAVEGVHDFLQGLHESTVEATVTITFMNDKVRSATGLPVGEITQNDQAGTIPLKMCGSGTFDEI